MKPHIYNHLTHSYNFRLVASVGCERSRVVTFKIFKKYITLDAFNIILRLDMFQFITSSCIRQDCLKHVRLMLIEIKSFLTLECPLHLNLYIQNT